MFAFSSRPVCRNGKLEAAAMDGFDYFLRMNYVAGTLKGYNVLERQIVVGNDGTTATQCYLSRREDVEMPAKYAFPQNTLEDGGECNGRVVSCTGHGLTDYLSWEKTPKFVPTGRIEIYGAIPAAYKVSLSVKRYAARGGCWPIDNKADYLQAMGTDILTGSFELSESDCPMKCGAAVNVDLSFLLDPEKNEHAPNWEEDGVAWLYPTLTLQCVG